MLGFALLTLLKHPKQTPATRDLLHFALLRGQDPNDLHNKYNVRVTPTYPVETS